MEETQIANIIRPQAGNARGNVAMERGNGVIIKAYEIKTMETAKR